MKLVRIEDGNSVVRHCKRKDCIRDGDKVVGVFPSVFYLRTKVGAENAPEKFLSAIYYEFFDGSAADRMKACMDATPVALKVGEAMVRLGAAEIRAEGNAANRPLRVTHEASHKLVPSKARIEGLPIPPDEELASGLAVRAVIDIFQVETARPRPQLHKRSGDE